MAFDFKSVTVTSISWGEGKKSGLMRGEEGEGEEGECTLRELPFFVGSHCHGWLPPGILISNDIAFTGRYVPVRQQIGTLTTSYRTVST